MSNSRKWDYHYSISVIDDVNAVSAAAGSTLASADIDKLSNKIRDKVGGVGWANPHNPIVSSFSSNGRLYLIHGNHPIGRNAGGGKSRAKNSYKKYMKKTRKRN